MPSDNKRGIKTHNLKAKGKKVRDYLGHIAKKHTFAPEYYNFV